MSMPDIKNTTSETTIHNDAYVSLRDTSDLAALSLPYTMFGTVVTEELLDDFDNPEIEGLVYRVDKDQPIQIDENYMGCYQKGYWGQKGAGLYVHHSEHAADTFFERCVTEPRHNATSWHKTALRISAGIHLDQRDATQMETPVTLTDTVAAAYMRAFEQWVELSKLEPNEQLRVLNGKFGVTDIRGYKREFLDNIEAYLTNLQDHSTRSRPVLTMGMLTRVTELAGSPEYYANSMFEGELAGLLLKNLGYDGILYPFNQGLTASVTWNLGKIGTAETWATRLAQK